MTNEERQLLLTDLCARLPYGVYILVHDTFKYSTVPYENVYLQSSDIASLIDSIPLNERYNSRDKNFNRIIKEHKDFLEFKSYLRPMSSMTGEEKEEYDKLCDYCLEQDIVDYNIQTLDRAQLIFVIDWLNKKHFDYRCLISLGLALEAPEGMYNTKTE